MGVMETRAYRSTYLLGKGWPVSRLVSTGLISVWYCTTTERVPAVSGTDASFVVQYALTSPTPVTAQATACAPNGIEISPGVVN